MLKFKEFMLNEEDSARTKVQELKTELSQKFDEIKKAKDSKKPGDVASEIASINQQSKIYQEISLLMKTLSTEMGKVTKTPVAPQENIY